jgi:putative transposase
MKTVADVIGLARSNLAERAKHGEPKPVGRPPQPDEALVAEIKAVIADLPTYGYRRVHAILRRRAMAEGRQPPNHKRVYGAMKRTGLLLKRHAGGAERRYDGRISVARPNLRWCSDGFEVACDNGEKVRIAFALDCCDREAMSFVATTGGIGGDEVRDLMVAAVEHRFGRIDRLPDTIEWLSDNGSGYIATRPAASPATSASSLGPRPSRALSRTAWRKPSCARSSETTSASARGRTPKPLSGSYLAGSLTTMRFTRTGRSDTVHPASSSGLAPPHDRVRSFGGNNTAELRSACPG